MRNLFCGWSERVCVTPCSDSVVVAHAAEEQQLTLWQFSGLVLSGVLLMIISSSGALETL
jgi:hypothetical protein